MGSFEDIVYSATDSLVGSQDFSVGLRIHRDDDRPGYDLSVRFRSEKSRPVTKSVRFDIRRSSRLGIPRDEFLEIIPKNGGTMLRSQEIETEIDYSYSRHALDYLSFLLQTNRDSTGFPSNSPELLALIKFIDHRFPFPPVNSEKTLTGQHASPSLSSLRFPYTSLPDLVPVAPIRSKPARMYYSAEGSPSSEVDHAPGFMGRLAHMDPDRWQSLRGGLRRFGLESGLFQDLRVKTSGEASIDPVQIEVQVHNGSPVDLIDVGYGVNQCLPILVEILAGAETARDGERMYSLQQPEVHLHPSGQAELASLFVHAYREWGSRFLIETHSDHIIDRIRIEVRLGRLNPKDVSILYFAPQRDGHEAQQGDVGIHTMTLDKYGNLENPPEGYREFFSKETDRLLGFTN